jgi:hypothetical protein
MGQVNAAIQAGNYRYSGVGLLGKRLGDIRGLLNILSQHGCLRKSVKIDRKRDPNPKRPAPGIST